MEKTEGSRNKGFLKYDAERSVFMWDDGVDAEDVMAKSMVLDTIYKKVQSQVSGITNGDTVVPRSFHSKLDPTCKFKISTPPTGSNLYKKFYSFFGEKFYQKIIVPRKKKGGLAARRKNKAAKKAKEDS
ncbi:unnamed protein product [Moneuplotes crassus]|uniref:Uncharacterized protein n=1 Tax=Euplotes crassus TaxID=5936 RepID=A0AAD2D831_EUPCR|nr:unnamed protein product [Moneuplotes crassus]